MRAAPQVLYPLGKPRLRHALLTLLLLATLSVMAAVAILQPGHRLWVLMGLLLLPAIGFSWRVGPPPGTRLLWDGQCWHLQGTGPISGQLQVVLDLQRVLLLRWSSSISDPDHAWTWLWIEQDADPVIWMDVRRAVYWNAR